MAADARRDSPALDASRGSSPLDSTSASWTDQRHASTASSTGTLGQQRWAGVRAGHGLKEREQRLGTAGQYQTPGSSGPAPTGGSQGAQDPEELEAQKEARVADLWRRLDRDHSGSITRDELDAEPFFEVIRSAVAPDKAQSGGASHGRTELNMNAAINFAMRKADSNGNGDLSFKEFRSLLLALSDARSNTSDLAFSLFDVDQNHNIDKKEFRELCRFFLGHNVKEKEFREEWELMTLDGPSDLEATKSQYVRWLHKTMHPVFSKYAPPQEADDTVLGSFQRKGQRQRVSTSLAERPRWNKRLSTGPNPGHINDARPIGTREYFSNSQSLPQLQRFYESYGDHFARHMDAMEKPEPPRAMSALHPKCLSSEGGTPLNLAGRHNPAGTMRDHGTGRVTLWEDHWTPPVRFTQRFRAGDRPLSPRADFGEVIDRHSQWAAMTLAGGFGRGRWNGGGKRPPAGAGKGQRRESLTKIRPTRTTALEAEPW